MTARRKTITLAGVATVIGLFTGAFGAWAATDRRISIHIEKSDVRVQMMCILAQYQVDSMMKVCAVNGVDCSPPAELRPEFLTRACQ